MTYADHLHSAFRYAALTLTGPAPGPRETAAVTMLQDDLAAVLAETTRAVTGMVPSGRHVVDVAHVARHPVRHMLYRLSALPAHAGYDDPTTSPAMRLLGRPDNVAAATTPVQAWQGLVRDVTLAGDLLRKHGRRINDQDRWAVVADVAALAETLAATRTGILVRAADTPAVRKARSHAAALAVEAREVARLAGGPGQPIGAAWVSPRTGTGVLPVSSTRDLPAGAAHLTAVIDGRGGSVSDLLAITRVIAQTSRASSRALLVAAAASPEPQRHALGVAAVSLDANADFLSRAVTAQRATLTGPPRASGLLIAQAREIGASALPRLQALTRAPARALDAVPALLAYAALAPELTGAIRGAFRRSATQGQVAIRDHTQTRIAWRPATTTDLSPLLGHLTRALTFGAPPAETLATARATAQRGAAAGPAAALTAALDQRRAQLRPARPSSPPVRRRPATRPDTRLPAVRA